MMKDKRRDRLDEMQDRKLLKLEERGFWILFWALAAAIAVQFALGGTLRDTVGELAVLLIGSVYLTATALKNGLWARTADPSLRGSALAAALPAILAGVLHAVRLARDGGFRAEHLLPTAGVMAGAFAVCFGILEAFRAVWRKRRSALDDIREEESEE